MIIDSHAHIIEHLSGMGARGEVRPVGHGRVRFLDGEEMQVIPREIGGAGFSAEQLLEQMELLVDTTRLRLVRRSSIAPLDGMCKIVIIGEDNIICSFDYNLTTNSIYIGDRIYALRSTQSVPLSELVSAVCGEV